MKRIAYIAAGIFGLLIVAAIFTPSPESGTTPTSEPQTTIMAQQAIDAWATAGLDAEFARDYDPPDGSVCGDTAALSAATTNTVSVVAWPDSDAATRNLQCISGPQRQAVGNLTLGAAADTNLDPYVSAIQDLLE